jgi:ubiquinone/menaquinone biosynthesis C-methylase UbiE
MDHSDRVSLLKNGISPQSRVWAEFGSGHGAFTLALAELITPDGIIYSVDRDSSALREQERTIRERFPRLKAYYSSADFSKPLNLPMLDGILLANALHFIQDKETFLSKVGGYFKPEGRLLIVEYNVEQGNHWVPYPISFESWKDLAARCGFGETLLLNTIPSRYHREIYSALSCK